MALERFLLCRPQGGLNDNLTQIEKCWRYAEQHRRTLIIDTADSSGFLRPFGTCFIPIKSNTKVITHLAPELFEQIGKLDTLPKCIEGRLDKYERNFSQKFSNFVDSESNEPLTFDFSRDHQERVLVHDQLRGGVISLNCLARLKLLPDLKADVQKLLAPLRTLEYAAIHVRNSDYETDYKNFFSQIRPETISKKLLICSDSAEVIEYAKNYFTESEVVTLAETPGTNGKPLHYYAHSVAEEIRYQLFVKTIADLIGLAAAENLFICRLKNGGLSGGFSGFSLLASNLHKSPAIIRQLLTDQPRQHMSKAVERFLLCRPQGGLNDNLSQIEKCWRYAEQHRRTLIIDTAGSSGFMRPFGDCFRAVKSQTRVIAHPSRELLESLEKLDTFPKCVQGRLDGYQSQLCKERNYVEMISNDQLSFDFSRDYEEQLLVHDQCGGDVISLDCLARLKLTPELRSDVFKRLVPLKGRQYVAVVVRNTDYKTDYEDFFGEIRSAVTNRTLLVCSDSVQVLEYAKNFFSASMVITLAETPDTGGQALADFVHMVDEEQRYKILVKAISDLIGLAAADALFVSQIKGGGVGGFSGFTLLAANLHKDLEIARQLLAD